MLLSASGRAIAIEMGGVSRYFSKISGSGVDSTPPEFWQYTSNLYRRTPPICNAVPCWHLSLEKRENSAIRLLVVPQHASYLYRSAPRTCTGSTFEKYQFLIFVTISLSGILALSYKTGNTTLVLKIHATLNLRRMQNYPTRSSCEFSWQVPNPPGASPLVAERAFRAIDY